MPESAIPYKFMLEHYYPLLRRMEISFRYDVRGLSDEEAVHMAKTNPADLSLYEMYRAYTLQGVKKEEMYLLAVYHFPQDPIALINASSVFLAKNDTASAWDYLKFVLDDPRAFNNIGLYYLLTDRLDKAKHYLDRALAHDPANAERNLAQMRRLIKQREALENYSATHQYKVAGM